jgi:ubiquinol-cytochrome c reductase iron-sulfur subunit
MKQEKRSIGETPEETVKFSQATESHSSSWTTIGAKLVWKAGKRIIGSLLRERIEPLIPAVTPPETRSATQIESVRAGDRNLTLERERNVLSRIRWGTLLAAFLFAASFCGAAGFLFIYWTGGSNQSLGGCLAIFFGGLSVGLVINAQLLAVHKEASVPRESMQPPFEERAATLEDFRLGEFELQRRSMLKWVAALGMGTVTVMFVSLLQSLLPNPFLSLYTGVWKRGQRLMTADGKPVKVDALSPGSTTIAFPEDSIGSEKTQTVLIRVDPHLLQLPGDRADWAPLGYLAYSRICTHAGCPVGMYEKTAHLLMCPCHQSTFDVLRAAQPTGGPAARPLPQLPLYVDGEGTLCAGGDFSNLPGPGFWGTL